MHPIVKCLVCGSLVCVCIGGPVLAKKFDAAKVNDLAKGVSTVMVASTSASTVTDFFYVENTMGGPEIKAVLAEGIKSFKSRR